MAPSAGLVRVRVRVKTCAQSMTGPHFVLCMLSIFRAPEIFLGLPFSEAIDMWSLGVVMGVMMFGFNFLADTNIEQDVVGQSLVSEDRTSMT